MKSLLSQMEQEDRRVEGERRPSYSAANTPDKRALLGLDGGNGGSPSGGTGLRMSVDGPCTQSTPGVGTFDEIHMCLFMQLDVWIATIESTDLAYLGATRLVLVR